MTRVVTHGKHLVLFFSNDCVIHTHSLQYNSWQIGKRGFELRRPLHYIRLRIITKNYEAVFYHGPVMEIMSVEEFERQGNIQTLGPDVLHEDFDSESIFLAIRRQAEREIGDLLLDQRIVSGIGNIYKSEGLFLAALHPQTPARSVTRDDMRAFFGEVLPLMQAGRFRLGATVTLPEELQFDRWTRNWVYRRRGQPCFVCGTTILMIRQGEFERTTYFCPTCQARPFRHYSRTA